MPMLRSSKKARWSLCLPKWLAWTSSTSVPNKVSRLRKFEKAPEQSGAFLVLEAQEGIFSFHDDLTKK
jgi:hypothetical protein